MSVASRIGRLTAAGQGAFWLAMGLWPLVHYRSFEAVTGPKEDDWLVKTIGGLIAVVGGTLLASARRRDPTPEAAVLGAAGAAALALADLRFVARGRISKIYLLDVLAEAPFLAGWMAFALGRLRGDADAAGVSGSRCARSRFRLRANPRR